jgi:hypothetical protein
MDRINYGVAFGAMQGVEELATEERGVEELATEESFQFAQLFSMVAYPRHGSSLTTSQP